MKRLTIGVLTAVLLVLVATPALAQTGPTEAPDLLSVGNFRAGPDTDNGQPQTLVDYTFDQDAYFNGGDRTNFHLIPLNAGDPVDARRLAPPNDTEGDEVVTVLYVGELNPDDYARGYVDTGVVNSNPNNAGNKNPANINQSEPVSNAGKTENRPGLCHLRRRSAGPLRVRRAAD